MTGRAGGPDTAVAKSANPNVGATGPSASGQVGDRWARLCGPGGAFRTLREGDRPVAPTARSRTLQQPWRAGSFACPASGRKGIMGGGPLPRAAGDEPEAPLG